MNIKFYKVSQPDNSLIKSVQTPVLDLEGTLREESSILNPSISVEADSDILGCNYCYIEEFSRYYFIRDIISVRNRIWRIDMAVDVLFTYRNIIYDQTGFVERNAVTFDSSVEDKERDFLYPEETRVYKCYDLKREGATIDTWSIDTKSAKNIVLTFTCTRSYKKIGTTYFYLNFSTLGTPDVITAPTNALHDITDIYIPDTWSSNISVESTSEVISLINKYSNDEKIGLTAVSIFPFTPDHIIRDIGGTKFENVTGLEPYSAENVGQFSDFDSDITTAVCDMSRWYCLADFNIPQYDTENSNWLNYKRNASLFVPFFGWIDIDLARVRNANLRLYCYPLLSTQEGLFFLTSGNIIIWSGRATIAQSVPVSRDNSRELKDQNIQFAISSAVSALTMASGILLAPTTGGVSLIGAVGSGLAIGGKAISMATTQHHDSNPQVSNSNQGMFGDLEPYLKLTTPTTTEPVDDYRRIFGLPLHRTMALVSLKGTGFTKVTGVQLNIADSAMTQPEASMLTTALADGVLL